MSLRYLEGPTHIQYTDPLLYRKELESKERTVYLECEDKRSSPTTLLIYSITYISYFEVRAVYAVVRSHWEDRGDGVGVQRDTST